MCRRDSHPLEWQLASLHQTRTCRIPASGSSRESFARVGVKAVDDPRRGKRMALEDRVEAVPVERTFSAMPSPQPFLPQHHDLAGEPSYASRVARYAVVGIVASQHLGQMGVLVAQGSMPIVSAPIADRRQRSCVPAFSRHLPTPFNPFLDLAQIWEKPRKSNVALSVSGRAGFPHPVLHGRVSRALA